MLAGRNPGSFCSCGIRQAASRWFAGLDALRPLHGSITPTADCTIPTTFQIL
jgi:hypothetical protein